MNLFFNSEDIGLPSEEIWLEDGYSLPERFSLLISSILSSNSLELEASLSPKGRFGRDNLVGEFSCTLLDKMLELLRPLASTGAHDSDFVSFISG